MPPRTTSRPVRENDFSAVGKVGRRTGVTLPPGRLDANGIEEISGLFSSPRKSSPLRKTASILESVEDGGQSKQSRDVTGLDSSGITPSQALSARKSLPVPRSVSPRKSGISGSARRSNVMSSLGQDKSKNVDVENEVIPGDVPSLTPTVPATVRHRFSPEKTPLRDQARSRPQTVRTSRRATVASVPEPDPEIQADVVPTVISANQPTAEQEEPALANGAVDEEDYALPTISDDDHISTMISRDAEEHDEPLPSQIDDEDADQSFVPEQKSQPRSKERAVANSRRKRKSDAIENEPEPEAISSPAAKRAKRISDQSSKSKSKKKSVMPETQPAESDPSSAETIGQPEEEATVETIEKPVKPQAKRKQRAPLKKKDANLSITSQQQKDLDNIVEKVKARPGQKKSLYVLRRETPADDGATHTRSGRVSVKPLAYWRNERCVFGGSPGGATLQDGARFPLNSIREIIRTEEIEDGVKKKKSKAKSQKKGKQGAQSSEVDQPGDVAAEEDDGDDIDPDAEEWETEIGTFKGPISVWDSEQGAPIDEEEEIDLAYAPAAIQTRDVKDSTFKYAKLLRMGFFGSGIVELPPGGVKKPKNSRMMHMSFFVAKGRVTVSVGALHGVDNRFSVGEGGWWHVPRGNQYSIENEHGKTASIFFSQACEQSVTTAGGDE